MFLVFGIIFVIVIIGIIAGIVANSLRSSGKILESWTDKAIIDQAERIDIYDPRNEKKIKKLIAKLGPIATRNKNAEEARNTLLKALEEEAEEEKG